MKKIGTEKNGQKKIELLAPGGDIDSIKAAIVAGADAVYCGLNQFNARNRAANISFDDLNGVLNLAHQNHCKVFLTLNILIMGSEIRFLFSILNKLINTGIDGVIVQDLGLFYLLSKYFKGLEIHASTQFNAHNEGQVKFLKKLGVNRVNLSRELNIHEIKALTLTAHKNKISTEVFVHGSYCLSFSGLCYISSVHSGNSGNRGRCSQPCRDRYLTTPEGKNFPLNLKDNCAYTDLIKLSDAGVDALKIEGRIKKLDYVYTVVNCWKKQLQRFYNQNDLNNDTGDLYKVFNRDFSNAYLKGDINKNMFIDNPRDYSIKQFSGIDENFGNKKLAQEEIEYYEAKAAINTTVKNKIKLLSIEKSPLTISISGKANTPLKFCVKAIDTSFVVLSKTNLVPKNEQSISTCLTYNFLLERLKAINDTQYYIEHLELENLQSGLFISFNEISSIKKRILYILKGEKEMKDPVEVPFLNKQSPLKTKPVLSILISSQKDLSLCDKTLADIFFQLPNSFKHEGVKKGHSEFIDFFLKNKKLIPWFPSVLIGDNYTAALDFLSQVQPKMIVTNNAGIAYEAYKKGIAWIAGPYLNLVNSFGLFCLKENFNCYGAFISNEISKYQLRSISHPENFKLYYSIYHPIVLLTSRQCLLHQVIGCKKTSMDENCVQNCKKSSSITNLNKVPMFIEKTQGNYHSIYNHQNFLNTDIVTDLPNIFSGFSIDLRDIKTETKFKMDKAGIVKLFENFLHGNLEAGKALKRMIHPTTKTQYKKGI